MNYRERIVEPMAGWEIYREKLWGENSVAAEKWFAIGESLKQADLDRHFDDGQVAFAKARKTLRSVACLLGLAPTPKNKMAYSHR